MEGVSCGRGRRCLGGSGLLLTLRGAPVGEAGAGEGALREAYLQPSVAKVMNKLVRPSACKAKGYMGHIVTPFL